MKTRKFSIPAFLLVLTTLFLLFYCQKENSSTEMVDLQKQLDTFNGGKLEHQQGELLKGRVVISPLPERRIAILVQDATINESIIYVLQMSSDQAIELKKLQEAQVLFLRNSLFIHSISTPEDIMVSIDDMNPIAAKGLTPTKKFIGYGLSRIATNKIADIKRLNNAEIYNLLVKKTDCTCECYRPGGTTNCGSGGTGSTSCSKKSGSEYCSVSCSTGYYACCNCVTSGD